MIKNYISKILLAQNISRNLGTFINLLVDTKKYTYHLKRNSLDTKSNAQKKYSIQIAGKKMEVSMRTYKGDILIFYEIFWKKVYKTPTGFFTPPKTIIDLGGHVGFTSIFYALEYPNAKIYSVEASRENFNLLKENVSQFENIIPINKAIYPTDGEVLFDESGYSYNTKIGSEGKPIESISVNTLLKVHNIQKIDLIKIDIEGAEIELLKNNTEWLEMTDNIIIELHRPYTIEELKKDLEPHHFKIITPSDDNGLENIFASKIT